VHKEFLMALPVVLQAPWRSFPVTIKTRDVPLEETLKEVIYAKLQSGLGRFGHRIRSVFLWVEDTNGPRDGSGIRCQIVVSLTSGRRLSVSAEAGNEYAAVAHCVGRARRHLDQFLKRRRHLKRRVKERR
jgi:ribosome-associated translation inhibitor RaiA